jgi:hypothetical protein
MKKIGIINMFPELFSVEAADVKMLAERLGGECAVVCSADGMQAKAFDAVVAYNSAIPFCEQILPSIRNGAAVLETVNSAGEERYLYRRDKHFNGAEYLHACRFKELIRTPKIKVLIAVPCYERAQLATLKAIYDLIIPEGCNAELEFVAGYTVVQARNRIVAASLGGGFDYTLFVDSDVVAPQHLLYALMRANSEVATGWYVKKIPGQDVTELYGPDKLQRNGMVNILASELPQDGSLVKIAGCGFGCTLVKNELFKRMGSELWFEYIEGKGGCMCSEDLYFCQKAAAAGATLIADTSLRCPHVGLVAF